MSDATDFTAALNELKRIVQADDHPVLTYGNGTYDSTKELDVILDRHKRAVTYTNATAYSYGQVVMPTTRNGYRYRVTVPGMSGAAEPTWPTSFGGRVESGSNSPVLTFEEVGPEFENIYDVRGAAYEALDLKCMKAANDNQYLQDSRGSASSFLFLNLQRQRDRYQPLEVA